MATSQVFTGARSIFKLGGVIVGYSLGVSGTTGITYQPIQVLGNLAVQEHVPTAYTVELSAQMSRMANFTRLAKAESFPQRDSESTGENSGGKSAQVMPAFGANGLNILQSGELKAEIVETISGLPLYTIEGVKASQKAWEVAAAGAVAENVTFVARICNENGESDAVIENGV